MDISIEAILCIVAIPSLIGTIIGAVYGLEKDKNPKVYGIYGGTIFCTIGGLIADLFLGSKGACTIIGAVAGAFVSYIITTMFERHK